MRITILLISALLISCGIGADTDAASNDSWAGPFNSAGFPAVAGDYAFITIPINYVCSDGSTGSTQAVSFNLTVNQDGNELSIPNKEESLPGLTIIEQVEASGLIAKDASYSMFKTLRANIVALDTVATFSYSTVGGFLDDAWYGDYSYTALFPEYKGSCEYKTKFTGDKLNTNAQAKPLQFTSDTDVNIYTIVGKAGLQAFLR